MLVALLLLAVEIILPARSSDPLGMLSKFCNRVLTLVVVSALGPSVGHNNTCEKNANPSVNPHSLALTAHTLYCTEDSTPAS